MGWLLADGGFDALRVTTHVPDQHVFDDPLCGDIALEQSEVARAVQRFI